MPLVEDAPPPQSAVHHIWHCFGYAGCMIAQMRWLIYSLIIHTLPKLLLTDNDPVNNSLSMRLSTFLP